MSIHFLAGPGWMACRGGAVMTNARLSLGLRESTCSIRMTLTGCIGTPYASDGRCLDIPLIAAHRR